MPADVTFGTAPNRSFQIQEAQVPGWETDNPLGVIEIWESGHNGGDPAPTPSFDGMHHAEIASTDANFALTQDISGLKGDRVEWSVYHRGRRGLDTADVFVSEIGGTPILLQRMQTDNTVWQRYSGAFVPDFDTGRFEFRGVSTAPGAPNAAGNFIDLFQVAVCAAERDRSDAPADGSVSPNGGTTAYGTPNHVIISGIQLGSTNTFDAADPSSPAADADTDDGVIVPTLTQGQAATITINTSGASGLLQAWIDWNGDGTFAAGEQIATNVSDGGTGTISLNVTPPASSTTNPTFARFRWSTETDLGATESALDGEVEDYQLRVFQTSPPPTPTIVPAGGSCSAFGGSLVGPNLITGGSFPTTGPLSSSIPGATTTYSFASGAGFSDGWPNDGNFTPNDGEYLVTSRTGPVLYGESNLSSPARWHDLAGVQFSTNTGDRFFVVNADTTPGPTIQLSVNVTAGTAYDFTAFLTNLFVSERNAGRINPNVAFEVSEDGGATWSRLVSTGEIAATTASSPPVWTGYGSIYQATSTGPALIRLITIAPGGSGNDFALDELVFQECSLPFNPAFALVKSADTSGLSAPLAVGDTISYTFSVENTGDVALDLGATPISDTTTLGTDGTGTAVTLTTGPTLVAASDTNSNGLLDVGETFQYTATFDLTQAAIDAGGVHNTASTTGNPVDNVGNDLPGLTDPTDTSDNDLAGDGTDGTSDGNGNNPTVVTLTPSPELEVVKSVSSVADTNGNGLFGDAGDTVNFVFTVENVGNTALA
ncbi:MAG: GEVED domain-containing protein, partial [Rhizobiaceae bacterium]|nr:GEVED domain-containing protein [Rhizobiaceae bacterium]